MIKIKMICPICGKEFEAKMSEIKRGGGKYCSVTCYQKSKETKITQTCKHCGKEFKTSPSKIKNGGGKYCSRKCRDESKNIKITRICEICNKGFKAYPSTIKRGGGKYCSIKCKNKAQETKMTRICEICGKEFWAIPSNIKIGKDKYCSMECKNKALTGENNPNWIGGISKIYCEKFNTEFKRRVAAFWYLNNENICPVCEKPIIDETPHCHHAYYDKKACCLINISGKYFSDLGIKNNEKIFEIIGDPNKFVPLHHSCHTKTNNKSLREFYARKFETIINDKFGGKSYFTKEEYTEFLIQHPKWIPPYK